MKEQERLRQCEVPGCTKSAWVDGDETKCHDACGLTHQFELMRIRLWSTPVANPYLACLLPGCLRHVYVEPNGERGEKGRVHDYCGLTHARAAGQLANPQGADLPLNGGIPSVGSPLQEVGAGVEGGGNLKAVQSLLAKHIGDRGGCWSAEKIDHGMDVYKSHPWEIPDIKRCMQAKGYEAPSHWYTYHVDTVQKKRKPRVTVEGWHWKQMGKVTEETLGGVKWEKSGLTYMRKKGVVSKVQVPGHWRMDVWNMKEPEEESGKPYVLHRIRNQRKEPQKGLKRSRSGTAEEKISLPLLKSGSLPPPTFTTLSTPPIPPPPPPFPPPGPANNALSLPSAPPSLSSLVTNETSTWILDINFDGPLGFSVSDLEPEPMAGMDFLDFSSFPSD